MWSVVEVRKVRSDTRLVLCEIVGMKNFDIRKDMDKVSVLKSITEMEPDRLRRVRLSTTFLAGDARAWHHISSPLYHKTMDQLETHLDASAGTNLPLY